MSTKSKLFFSEDADLAERAQLKADLVAGLVRNLDGRELQLIRLRYGLHDGQSILSRSVLRRWESIERESTFVAACLFEEAKGGQQYRKSARVPFDGSLDYYSQ